MKQMENQRKKLIIGLTGNIASGKSAVSALLEQLGAWVVDADQLARQVVVKGSPALTEIVTAFGPEMLHDDGTLNRKALGDLVFDDEDQREMLNRITHPRIRRLIQEHIDTFWRQSGKKVLVIEAALMYETGLDKLVDQVWFVDTTQDLQMERLMKRNRFSRQEALQRIRAQEPPEMKRLRAHVVLTNTSDLASLENQVQKAFNKALSQE
ncbi:MAG: dephospho-CoA kinase [Bacillota bacterium]|nr:dephospho-CoA kinase [Bacillota bacterium]MDW7677731.1 dephospho-CoA kinase [Bacillota bacterium]